MKPGKGVFSAVVIDNIDPEGIGRVKVRLAQVSASGRQGYETWARLVTVMAGKRKGTWFIPDVDDEVLVVFGGGAAGQPYVLGSLWSNTSPPPERIDSTNNKKVLRSRNGVTITLNDQSGQESFMVETPGGQKILLQDGSGSLEITDSQGNVVKLEPSGITVNAAAQVTINASRVAVSSGMVTVDAGMSRFSGVVQCDTLISNSVISASYTPGAGNIA